ncbi:MAG: ferritin-like domain-containing protein [Thermoplasmata archaeon]
MKEKLDEFSFKELMAYSIESEKQAKKFYLEFSDAALGALVKGRFKSLANDEEIHKKELLKRYEEKFGTRDYTVPDSDDLPPHESSFDFSNALNVVDALDHGIKNEENAMVIYEYMADRFSDYTSFFKYLALMEKGHHASLAEELALMQGEIEKRGGRGDKKELRSFWAGMGSEQDSAFGDREHMR